MILDFVPQASTLRQRTCVRKKQIDVAINNFPRRHRIAIQREAMSHFALADLAISFPALLFVIAVPHKGIDAMALKAAVIAGEPLKNVARLAGLPMWLRHLKPGAFNERLQTLPGGELISRQIVNFIPKRPKNQMSWLDFVMYACRWGHEGFGLWMAKSWRSGQNKQYHGSVRLLALWAWYSEHPETEFGKLVQNRWGMNISFNLAIRYCNSWIENVNMHLDLQIEQRSPKLRERTVNGFDFVHLADSLMLADEATAMRNCLKSFGYDVAYFDKELWSVRKGNQRIASLSIGKSRVDGLPAIDEIKLAGNRPVTKDVALAARRWFEMHDLESIVLTERDFLPEARRKVWQRGFKPYWLAKRALPWWLRMNARFELRLL